MGSGFMIVPRNVWVGDLLHLVIVINSKYWCWRKRKNRILLCLQAVEKADISFYVMLIPEGEPLQV
jgi:hypothetical protein